MHCPRAAFKGCRKNGTHDLPVLLLLSLDLRLLRTGLLLLLFWLRVNLGITSTEHPRTSAQ